MNYLLDGRCEISNNATSSWKLRIYDLCLTTKRRMVKEMQVVGGPNSTDEGMSKINTRGKSRESCSSQFWSAKLYQRGNISYKFLGSDYMKYNSEDPRRQYISELCTFTLVIASSISVELAKKEYRNTQGKEEVLTGNTLGNFKRLHRSNLLFRSAMPDYGRCGLLSTRG